MPTVPRLRLTVDTRALPAPELTTPRGNYATEGGEMGEALQRVGAQAAQLGIQLYQQQVIRKRQILQLEAGQQLDQLEFLTLRAPQATDPTTGETSGGGILLQEGKAPYEQTQKYLEDFDLQAGEIAKNAKTADERLLVGALIAQRRAQVVNQINTHANSELRKYEWNLTQSTTTSTINRMALNADQPEARDEALAELDRSLRTHLPRFGVTGPLLEQTIDQAKAKGHEAVVKQLIQDHKHGAAAQYWAQVKDSVQDAEARQQIQARVDSATTEQKAFAVVDELMATMLPKAGDDQTPIENDKIMAAIRQRLENDTEAYKVAVSYWASRKAAIEDARNQRVATLENPLMDAILDGVPSAVIRAMPQWRDAGTDTRRVIGAAIERRDDRIAAQRQAAISRSREDDRWRQSQLDRIEWSRFLLEASDEKLGVMDENTMRRLALTFESDSLQREVRQAWQRVQRERTGGSLAVTLADDDVKGVFAKSGYTWATEGTPAQWGSGSTGDARRAMFAQVVAAARVEIGRQESGGKKLTVEQKNQVVQQILDSKVMVQGFFSPSEQVGVAVDPSDRNRAYVPLAKIPQDHLAAAIKWFRANTAEGKLPENVRLTDEQLARKYQTRFEHSYAAMQMRLGTEAQFNELRRTRERGRD